MPCYAVRVFCKVLLALVVFAGCHGVPRLVSGIAGGGQRSAHRVSRSSVVPSRLVRLAASGRVLQVEHSGETTRWVMGGFRIERRGEQVTWATDRLVAPIVSVLRGSNDRSFFFITRHEVYEAQEFLGSLRLVHRTSDGRVGHGTGLAVTIHRGRLTGARAPVPGVVIDAAFGDDRRGIAIVEPGRAYATEDGGAHWRAVPMTDDVALRAVATPDTRWLVGTETAVAIDRDGNVREVLPDQVPRLEPVERPEITSLREQTEQNDLSRWLASSIELGTLSGSRVIFARPAQGNRHETDIVEYDLIADRLVPTASANLHCRVTALWTAQDTFAVCVDERLRLFRRAREGDWQPWIVARRENAVARCVVSSDGEQAACEGPCDGQRKDPRQRVLCERTGDGPMHHRPIEGGMLLGYDGGEPVVLAGRNGAEGTDFARVDATGKLWFLGPWPGEPWEIGRVMEPPSGPSPLRIGEDGKVRLLSSWVGEEEPWVILSGRPGEEFRRQRVPPGTRSVQFGRAGVVLAWRAPDVIEQSDDDGESWHSIEITNTGGDDTLRRMFEQPSRMFAGSSVHCREAGCRLGSAAVRLGWGPVATSQYGAHGVPETSLFVPSPVRWRCEATGSGLRWTDVGYAPLGMSRVYRDQTAQGWLLVTEEPARQGPRTLSIEARWQLRNAPVSVSPRRVRFGIDRYFPSGGRDSTRWSIVELGADEALVTRCGTGPGGLAPQCDLVALNHGGSFRRLVTFAAREVLSAHGSGGVCLLGTLEAPSEDNGDNTPGTAHTLVTMSRNGHVRVRPIALARDDGTEVGPYVLNNGEMGVARRRLADETVMLAPVDNERARTLPATAMHACSENADGEIALSGTGVLTMPSGGSYEMNLVVRYGLARTGLCLRGVEGSVIQLGDPGWLVVTAVPGERDFYGTAQLREGVVPVRCRSSVTTDTHEFFPRL